MPDASAAVPAEAASEAWSPRVVVAARQLVKEKWGQLTDDDLTAIEGRRDQLAGKLQERYGYAKDQAEREDDEFARTLQP
jgi:uncharacterized protein YjbJ (UPF0337 family)